MCHKTGTDVMTDMAPPGCPSPWGDAHRGDSQKEVPKDRKLEKQTHGCAAHGSAWESDVSCLRLVGYFLSLGMIQISHLKLLSLSSFSFLFSVHSDSDSRESRRSKFDSWVRKIPWRMEWQPTLISLAGEFQGQRSLAGYSPWGRKV